ncbi:MAG: hypothetical protein AAF846_15740 [Chloroflexota bacterium]
MNKNLKTALMSAGAALVITPIVALIAGFSFSVIIMLEIAVVALFTVVFVMIIGSEEDHYPTEAKDSLAVNRWSDRLGDMTESKVED